ncbi:hypothetical protein [Sulfurimonas sp.]|uniref:CiaD-like domain-containing protein n=1 Tax=Sulfurimonas sp. TaxID=2022749 RepID=UPI0025E242F0|nr:hypothetical protein [Sulfurimonas sp.]MDD5156987.1 hypothetical protein [Sulfurimonas sp.]
MELKDVILSTLAEMEEIGVEKNSLIQTHEFKQKINYEQNTREEYISEREQKYEPLVEAQPEIQREQNSNNELFFLESIRERMLVLFEGFQAPNNTNIEAKVDMTLNFLEYVLVSIDSRVSEIEKGSKK